MACDHHQIKFLLCLRILPVFLNSIRISTAESDSVAKWVMRILVAVTPCVLPVGAYADHELNNRNLIQGKALYSEHCASCHGVQLEGQPNWWQPLSDGTLPAPPHDESGHTWHHDNQLLFDYTKLGGEGLAAARGLSGFKSAMPGFADAISDEGIWDTLAYIRSTWSEAIKQAQAGRNASHSN